MVQGNRSDRNDERHASQALWPFDFNRRQPTENCPFLQIIDFDDDLVPSDTVYKHKINLEGTRDRWKVRDLEPVESSYEAYAAATGFDNRPLANYNGLASRRWFALP